MRITIRTAGTLAAFLAVQCAAWGAGEVRDIRFATGGRYDVQAPQSAAIRAFFERYPDIRLTIWSGLPMPTGARGASLSLAMAADLGPDIFEADIRQSVAQGFAYPLTEWIGRDGVLADGCLKLLPDGHPDLNGEIDADEARWPGWMEIPRRFRSMVTVHGEPYALPYGGGNYVGILYSKRLVRAAGLDPLEPPRTWEEFILWCRKLYNPDTKTFGVEILPQSWSFAPWVESAGSSINVQRRASPTTGRVHTFHEQAEELRAPDTGEDLSRVMPEWHCNIGGPEALAALAFYHRLRWQRWIADPGTGQPVEVGEADLARGSVTLGDREIPLAPEAVVEGSVAVTRGAVIESVRRLGRDLALYPLYAGDMTQFTALGIPAEDLGIMPFPGMSDAHRPVLQHSGVFFMIGKDVVRHGGDTPEQRRYFRDRVFDMLSLITSRDSSDEALRQKVAAGYGEFLTPMDLERIGFPDYIRLMPPENRRLWERMASGDIHLMTEPFTGRWLQFRDYLQREAIDLTLGSYGRTFDHAGALARLERDANSGIMYERPPEALAPYRARARIAAAVVAAVMLGFTILIVRGQLRRAKTLAGVYKGWLPWALLAPALVSIAVWGYYPLFHGMIMAFQDYRIAGGTRFVGLDNFIAIALDPNFYHYLRTTFRFVAWNLALSFFTPILLAILLSEVPRFKVFFRTLFFLPQMTSGLVVTLMWKDMYSAAPTGTLNRILSFCFGWLGFQPVDWLGNPATVMACVILPGIWAGAGIGSLIYLAALKAVPDELYEAAAIDGAGILRRLRAITLPTILPLVIINFIGAFIATFQGMAGIFLLTFGGPGKETMVMGMAIWQEAYVNLRFSVASSYAWILSSILIGFTYLQLRILRSVDFRRAEGN